MAKGKLQKMVAGLLVAMLLATSLPMLAPTTVWAAPLAQQLRDRQVRGAIPGGQFAKFWLGLEPEQSGATVSVVAEWDRPNPRDNGVGFFILDENGLRRIGNEALSSIALAAGDPNYVLNAPDNAMGASFNAIGLAPYTLVVYNDSATDANFTLTATNAFITDESNQVTGQSGAPAATTNETVEPAEEPTTPVAPVETTTIAPTTETTATETTTATVAPPVAAAPVAAEPAATVTATREVRATTMAGDLPEQFDQHFLGLVPSQRDGNISLSLTFDPQDNTELARRLNFWVLNEAGFTQFLRGTTPGEVAIAAGNRTFRGDTNERVASFNATGFGPYTVIVYNNSLVPGSYSLTVEGGLLIDDSGQTRTAQAAGALGTTGAVTVTATTTGTVTTLPAATTTTPTTATPTTGGRTGEPGGTYTVRAGDTLSLIARDIYGSVNVYQQICTLNGIANCNIIEVGDVLRLPTLEQVRTGVTAAAPAAAAAAPATTTTQPATITAAAPTTTLTTTQPVTPTTTVTPTGAVTPTRTTTPTAAATTATTTAGATAAGGTLVDALVADGRFTLLVQALQATGLDSVLEGRGPFTVFAPTDAAFAASLPTGAFEQLLNDPGGQLTGILRYHVVPGETMAADISNGMQASTVQGKTVRFEVQGNAVKINGANVVTADIDASNGVAHAIDAVILPPPE
jgi:uncharacterized surface protein with fasciclin (FAS1) repeats